MRRVLTQDLNTAINRADIHYDRRGDIVIGARIEYDGHSIGLSAEYLESTDYTKYTAFDVSDKEVTLTDNQHTIVHNFVKGLHDTEKQKQEDHQAQF